MSALAFAALATMAAAPGPRGDSAPPPGPEVEVRYTDDSTMKLRLLDEKLELVTRHGTLQIAVADVRRIDFATRIPTADADRITAAVAGLASSDYKAREKASAELKAYRGRAYPAVLKATGHSDPEVAKRAEEVAVYIRGRVPPAHLEHRDLDVVHTDDSKIAGRLTTPALRIHTFQFGELRLKLADVRTLGAPGAGQGEELANAPFAPPTLVTYANQFGKELAFKVTGVQSNAQIPGGGGTFIWGTDVYTLDSHVAAGAVHAGLVQVGQTATVRVRVVQSPAQFTGSVRNGVPSMPYGFYTGGAYEFVKK